MALYTILYNIYKHIKIQENDAEPTRNKRKFCMQTCELSNHFAFKRKKVEGSKNFLACLEGLYSIIFNIKAF